MKIFLAGAFWLLTSAVALAGCDDGRQLSMGWTIQPTAEVVLVGSIDPCDDVPDARYQGGGVQVKTVRATACFTPEFLVPGKGIVRYNGTFEYTADFVYNPRKGTHEVIKTVKNQPCWTHNVVVGTWMSVYVTCEFYTGWVAVRVTGPTTSDPTRAPRMMKVNWPFEEELG